MTDTEIINKLKSATNGLLMSSEAEYPFEVFLWENITNSLTSEKVLQQTKHPENTSVEVVPFEDFCRQLTAEQDWYGEEEKNLVAKFNILVKTLRNNLINLQVYRLGKIEIDVYIVGKTPTDNLAGVATKVVET